MRHIVTTTADQVIAGAFLCHIRCHIFATLSITLSS